jgi:hypothetical protein
MDNSASEKDLLPADPPVGVLINPFLIKLY